MKSAIAVVAVAAVATLVAMPALGDTTGTVTATVTIGAPCLTLSQSAVDFGVMAFHTQAFRNAGSATNCAGQAESLLARGSNATGPNGALWSLVAAQGNPSCTVNGTPSLNNYALTLAANQAGSSGLVLVTADQSWVTGVGAGASQTLGLFLFTPCTGSSGAGSTMTFSTTFTAVF